MAFPRRSDASYQTRHWCYTYVLEGESSQNMTLFDLYLITCVCLLVPPASRLLPSIHPNPPTALHSPYSPLSETSTTEYAPLPTDLASAPFSGNMTRTTGRRALGMSPPILLMLITRRLSRARIMVHLIACVSFRFLLCPMDVICAYVVPSSA